MGRIERMGKIKVNFRGSSEDGVAITQPKGLGSSPRSRRLKGKVMVRGKDNWWENKTPSISISLYQLCSSSHIHSSISFKGKVIDLIGQIKQHSSKYIYSG